MNARAEHDLLAQELQVLRVDRRGPGEDIAGAPDAGATALAMRDQYRLAQTGLDRRGGVADMDHERAAADGGAVDPFRRQAQVMRDRYRRLADGRASMYQ